MSASREIYLVHCSSCQAPFDAFDTPWCSCLVTERTLVCPSCLSCFCKAPASYIRIYTRKKHEIAAFKNYKVDDYLAKPLDFNQLRCVLQKHVGQEQ